MPPLLLASTCAVQWACERLLRLPSSGFRSPLITGLGLSLLLRTDAVWVPPLAATIAIGAKYLVRVRGKHVFNPGDAGADQLRPAHRACLVLARASGAREWRCWRGSPCWGWRWCPRSFRTDVSLAFLGSWVLLKLGAGALARAAAGGARSTSSWWGAYPLHLLHDLRPEDHARPAERADRLGRRGGRAGLRAPAPGLGDERAGLGAPPAVAAWFRCSTASSPLPASAGPPASPHRKESSPCLPPPSVVSSRCWSLPLLVLLHPAPALAFCGFYVGKADTQLFNDSSQVALVRDGDRTVLTMSNDYRGPLTEFALVVPVPTVLEREQIHVGEPQAARAPRRVLGAAAGGVLRPRPLPADLPDGEGSDGVLRPRTWPSAPARRRSATRRWGCASRRSTPWASTTSSSCRRQAVRRDWRRGCGRTATAFRRRPRPRSSRTSART